MSAKAEEIHSFIADEQSHVPMFLHYRKCGVFVRGGGMKDRYYIYFDIAVLMQTSNIHFML
jgi:hypothetical protein